MDTYQAYAPFYDGSGQIRFAVLFGQYLNELLQRHPAPGQRALDLACGTGTLALIMADRGFEVVGVDASPAMIDIARGRAEDSEFPERLIFLQGDMRYLQAHDWGGQPWQAAFDLVTCTYDSLNYLLTEADLLACFRGVATLLKPDGVFIADMNTRHFLEFDWGTSEVIERPGFIQVSQSQFDAATAQSTMLLSGFVGDDHQGYLRFDETHIERAYPAELVAQLLHHAGLVVEAAYECFTSQPIHDRAQRIAWVARR
ncbi:MAG: class I SAM-dependent methyltransferase [Roseiflexaceae bacterium]